MAIGSQWSRALSKPGQIIYFWKNHAILQSEAPRRLSTEKWSGVSNALSYVIWNLLKLIRID
jgi:hypothetical protein